MKRKFNVLAISLVLSCSVLFSSCIGSFSLWNKLLAWNHTVGDKFINELVFVAFHIVPIYPLAGLADILVLNSIEFWSGENPVTDVGKVEKIEGQYGIYTVETQEDGYHIEKEGTDETVDFRFNKEEKTWSVESDGVSTPILKIIDQDEVLMYLPDGSTMPVILNEAGVLAYKQVVAEMYFATK